MALRVISIDVGVRNLSIARLSMDVTSNDWKDLVLESWHNLDLFKDQNVNIKRVSTAHALHALHTTLETFQDEFIGTQRIDAVFIEKQPFSRGIGRVIMQHIASGLAMWFLNYFEAHSMILGDTLPLITFLQPTHKLNIVIDKDNMRQAHVRSKRAPKRTYYQRKKLAVSLASVLLEQITVPVEIKRMFDISKKKDDLADAVLQATFVLQRCALT